MESVICALLRDFAETIPYDISQHELELYAKHLAPYEHAWVSDAIGVFRIAGYLAVFPSIAEFERVIVGLRK